MPINSTRGASSAKAFGLTAGAALVEVDYLLVAGGGGGGVWGGGGGAGGYRASAYGPAPLNSGTKLKLTKGVNPVTVGGGGVFAPGPSILTGPPINAPGTDSILGTLFTATGGGKGAVYTNVGPGGSGGGAQGGQGVGFGNTPPVSPPQGNDGGGTPTSNNGSGGGGATEAGVSSGTGPGNPAGRGGAGVTNDINGTPTAYAGGAGGGASTSLVGGSGGGGSPCGTGGAGSGSGPGTEGTINRGGGGGSGGYDPGLGYAGASGGSGIVIVRAPSAVTFSVSPGTNSTSTTPGGCKVATFTVSGNLTIS